jgi:TatD DNase family protein
MNILDFHTHRTDATAALISVDPRRFDPQPGLCYSVGFHPWDTVEAITAADFSLLEQCARHPQVLAIGETGMDSLRGADLKTQEALFIHHLQLAHEVGKPAVIHSVRTAQQILAARRRAKLTEVPLAIHGFRGNEHVARTLLDAGCYLSFGARFNPAALLATPLDRLLIETDDAPTSIQQVATLIADSLQLSTDTILDTATTNARHFLSPPNNNFLL